MLDFSPRLRHFSIRWNHPGLSKFQDFAPELQEQQEILWKSPNSLWFHLFSCHCTPGGCFRGNSLWKIPNLTWKRVAAPIKSKKKWGKEISPFPKFSVLENYFGIFLTTTRKIPFKIPGKFCWESTFLAQRIWLSFRLGIFFPGSQIFTPVPNKSQISLLLFPFPRF